MHRCLAEGAAQSTSTELRACPRRRRASLYRSVVVDVLRLLSGRGSSRGSATVCSAARGPNNQMKKMQLTSAQQVGVWRT